MRPPAAFFIRIVTPDLFRGRLFLRVILTPKGNVMLRGDASKHPVKSCEYSNWILHVVQDDVLTSTVTGSFARCAQDDAGRVLYKVTPARRPG